MGEWGGRCSIQVLGPIPAGRAQLCTRPHPRDRHFCITDAEDVHAYAYINRQGVKRGEHAHAALAHRAPRPLGRALPHLARQRQLERGREGEGGVGGEGGRLSATQPREDGQRVCPAGRHVRGCFLPPPSARRLAPRCSGENAGSGASLPRVARNAGPSPALPCHEIAGEPFLHPAGLHSPPKQAGACTPPKGEPVPLPGRRPRLPAPSS